MIKFDTVHCLFEQSGTFKNVFKEKGYESFSYDLSDSFDQTDFVCDLFFEINNAFNQKPSIFDTIHFKLNASDSRYIFNATPITKIAKIQPDKLILRNIIL